MKQLGYIPFHTISLRDVDLFLTLYNIIYSNRITEIKPKLVDKELYNEIRLKALRKDWNRNQTSVNL